MLLKPDQQRIRALLTETIMLLCKNGLHFKSQFSVEALIGITLDESEVFLISIKETLHAAAAVDMHAQLSSSDRRAQSPACQENIASDNERSCSPASNLNKGGGNKACKTAEIKRKRKLASGKDVSPTKSNNNTISKRVSSQIGASSGGVVEDDAHEQSESFQDADIKDFFNMTATSISSKDIDSENVPLKRLRTEDQDGNDTCKSECTEESSQSNDFDDVIVVKEEPPTDDLVIEPCNELMPMLNLKPASNITLLKSTYVPHPGDHVRLRKSYPASNFDDASRQRALSFGECSLWNMSDYTSDRPILPGVEWHTGIPTNNSAIDQVSIFLYFNMC